jgi:uncharacterized protein (TIGR03437 family)
MQTTRTNRILLMKLATLGTTLPALIFAYATGPDATMAGVPGENTCTACHVGSSGSGSVTVTFPNGTTYTPGVKQHLVVTVTDATQKRWGFQLTARLSSNSKSQAGTFAPGADGYTQLVCTQLIYQSENWGVCPASMPLQYIEHTLNGTRLGQTKSATFAFDWMPPATDAGSVVIYVAGNAANGDGTERGDHIYTQKYTLTAASQQPLPSIASSGVVNAASFQAAVAPGGWVTIQGTNLANSTRSWSGGDFNGSALPTTLDGVGVTIDGKAAYVGYISPTQINVLAPGDSTQGPVAVQVANNGLTSAAGSGQLQTAAPAFFLWSGKYAVATRPDYSLVAPANLIQGVTTTPAKPGDVVILWGTGFGATTPAVDPGVLPPSDQLAYVANAVTVTVGGVPATVVGAALAPGNAGLYQIAVQVPSSVPDGDLPLLAQVSGIESPSNVLLSVQR